MTYTIYEDNTISKAGAFVGKYVIRRENNKVSERYVAPIKDGQPAYEDRVIVPEGLKSHTPEFQSWLAENGF